MTRLVKKSIIIGTRKTASAEREWLEIEREIRRARAALIQLSLDLRHVGALTAAKALDVALECLDRQAKHAFEKAYFAREEAR